MQLECSALSWQCPGASGVILCVWLEPVPGGKVRTPGLAGDLAS